MSANLNTGLLAMRAANLCKRFGYEPRDAQVGAEKPKTKAATKPATRKEVPVRTDKPEVEEEQREYRVCVVVKKGEAESHVWAVVSAAGPRRAGAQARAEVRKAGHEPVGVCATLRDDAPEALLKLAK